MPIAVKEFVGLKKTVLVLTGDVSDKGPFLPLSEISTLGYRLIQATTSAAARQALAAAQSGVNNDIQQLRGLSVAQAFTEVATPTGRVSLASLAAALGVIGGRVIDRIDAYTALESDGIIRGNTDAGSFGVTIPRSLGQGDATKTLFVMKTGEGQEPLIIQDDAVPPKQFAPLVQGGAAFAIVVVAGGVVSANGLQ